MGGMLSSWVQLQRRAELRGGLVVPGRPLADMPSTSHPDCPFLKAGTQPSAQLSSGL